MDGHTELNNDWQARRAHRAKLAAQLYPQETGAGVQEFYNKHHGNDGRFSSGKGTGPATKRLGAGFSADVAAYLKTQYQMDPDTATRLGLSQDGTKLLIPFKDENGKTTSIKWRDTAVASGEGRWGPPNTHHGLSVYENIGRKGPIFVVESPSEGLILAGHGKRVVFFDGADSLVSRTGVVDSVIHTRLSNILAGNHSILIPDNDERGEAFAKAVEPLVTRRVNPPPQNKDLREYLIHGTGDLGKLVG